MTDGQSEACQANSPHRTILDKTEIPPIKSAINCSTPPLSDSSSAEKYWLTPEESILRDHHGHLTVLEDRYIPLRNRIIALEQKLEHHNSSLRARFRVLEQIVRANSHAINNNTATHTPTSTPDPTPSQSSPGTEFLSQAHDRLLHGFPLTIAQQRELYYLATGKPIRPRKRCPDCQGEGKVHSPNILTKKDCVRCTGTGYLSLTGKPSDPESPSSDSSSAEKSSVSYDATADFTPTEPTT